MKRLAILPAALSLAACEHPGAVDDYGFDVDLGFTSRAASPSACFQIPEVTVTDGAGEILMRAAGGRQSPPCSPIHRGALSDRLDRDPPV